MYGFAMVNDTLAVCPLFPPAGAECVGMDGNEVMWSVNGGETRMTIPFFEGAACSVIKASVDTPEGPAPVSLLVPEPTGRLQMSVSISHDRGLWFAAAHVGPRRA